MPEFLIFFYNITFLFYFISQNYSYRIQNTLLIVSSSNVKGRVISTTITCGSANAYRQKGSNDDSTFILFTFYFIPLLFYIVPSLLFLPNIIRVCYYLISSHFFLLLISSLFVAVVVVTYRYKTSKSKGWQLKYLSYFFVVKYINSSLRSLR